MKKEFTISDRRWPTQNHHDLLLTINNRDAGAIKLEDLGAYHKPRWAMRLELWDDSWKLLPILAADLFQHTAGAEWGYASIQSATQAAAEILEAHGWRDITYELLQ